MKKIILVLALLSFTFTSKSQIIISLLFGNKLNTGKIEFGLDGGLNYSTLEGINGGKYFTGLNLGLYFDIKLKNPSWMIHTGAIMKSPMGIDHLPVYTLNDNILDSAFTGGYINRRLRYIDIPVMVKYRIGRNFYVEAGPLVGFRIKSFDEFIKKEGDKTDLTYDFNTKDAYHLLDAGIIGGLGYRLLKGHGMNIGVRYYLGLVNISTDNSAPKQYNRSFYLVVGIPIGSKKASQ